MHFQINLLSQIYTPEALNLFLKMNSHPPQLYYKATINEQIWSTPKMEIFYTKSKGSTQNLVLYNQHFQMHPHIPPQAPNGINTVLAAIRLMHKTGNWQLLLIRMKPSV